MRTIPLNYVRWIPSYCQIIEIIPRYFIKEQVDAGYKEILQGRNLWEGYTATFYRAAVTGAQLQGLIYKVSF